MGLDRMGSCQQSALPSGHHDTASCYCFGARPQTGMGTSPSNHYDHQEDTPLLWLEGETIDLVFLGDVPIGASGENFPANVQLVEADNPCCLPAP